MRRPAPVLAGCLAALAGFSTACAVHRQAKDPRVDTTLRIELGSFRTEASVDGAGSIRLTERVQMLGRIDAAPIFASEGANAETVQVLLHDGCYWVTADGFRNVWRLEPQPGTTHATYRPIPLPDPSAGPVRMSRWGESEHACVRLDAARGGPWFVRSDGELVDACG